MKSIITMITALVVLSSFSLSFGSSDSTSATTKQTKTTTQSNINKNIADSGSSKNRGILPQDKTNWSKIKDIFM